LNCLNKYNKTMADIILPEPSEGYEYIIVKKPRELLAILRDRRDELKAILDSMIKPTNQELIELGQQFHPYFEFDRELDEVRAKINELTQ